MPPIWYCKPNGGTFQELRQLALELNELIATEWLHPSKYMDNSDRFAGDASMMANLREGEGQV